LQINFQINTADHCAAVADTVVLSATMSAERENLDYLLGERVEFSVDVSSPQVDLQEMILEKVTISTTTGFFVTQLDLANFVGGVCTVSESGNEANCDFGFDLTDDVFTADFAPAEDDKLDYRVTASWLIIYPHDSAIGGRRLLTETDLVQERTFTQGEFTITFTEEVETASAGASVMAGFSALFATVFGFLALL
jgi:hypothetical protein